MCGIVGGVGLLEIEVGRGLDAMRHRGPDGCRMARRGSFLLGHARLAVVDLTDASAQPFDRGDVTLAYNGEVWNYAAMREALACRTGGDAEVFAAVLDARGPAGLADLQGMFAAAWHCRGLLHLARDRHGEAPLHWCADGRRVGFASELAALSAMGFDPARAEWVEPGEVVTVSASGDVSRRAWYEVPSAPAPSTIEDAAPLVRAALAAGVAERAVADAPVAVLLSGGLDSACIAALAAPLIPGLVAYTAVFDPRSADLRAAREVAAHIGCTLVEVPIAAPTADDARRVVSCIEMSSKAQVEIAWACLALAERISADDNKVVLSGEGSDELWASYGMSYHGIKRLGWDRHRRETFRAQHRKNFARCNKAFMRHGVECRLPFLNTALVELALNLPRSAVQARGRPKAVLQAAVADLLPESVVMRQKLAFQDGLGIKPEFERACGRPRAFYEAAYRDLVLREPRAWSLI